MNEYKIKYIASPISEITKVKTVQARSCTHAVVILENELGHKVDDIISIELIET